MGEDEEPILRKKVTHLRCERQRREAINIGYHKLKGLLPASFSLIGCKTTNASILFRTVDYITQLKSDLNQLKMNMEQCDSQASTLQLISDEYENMSAANSMLINNSLPYNLVKTFIDLCFQSFHSQINLTNIQTITKTLLFWVEQLNYQAIAAEMIVSAYNHE